ncbi:hypothetical protein ABPG75_012128 [Micractinium tetrahymenae]
MPKPSKKAQAASADDQLLLESSLIALRKAMMQQADSLEQQTMALHLPQLDTALLERGGSMVHLRGVGSSPHGGGCQLPSELLLVCSAFYEHAASFGQPPSAVELPCGDRCVRLLGAALTAGSTVLVPASAAELLQAASYLQVAAVLEACSAYLQRHVLDAHPAAVLRAALDLGLSSLAAHIADDFLQEFYKLSGEKAALLLREWPPTQRRELLDSRRLAAPTELCLIETLCHLAKAASSADAVALLDCTRFHLMTSYELAAADLYLQHNSKWVDRRLSTALAWRLLNARVGADLAAWPAPAGIPGERSSIAGGSGIAAAAAATAAARMQGLSLQDGDGGGGGSSGIEEGHPRKIRLRCLAWGLLTAHLAAWSGAAMFLASRHIPCSFDSPEASRPLVLQLEREDPRHGPAEAVGGTTGRAGGDTDSGGSGWDLQLSRDPERFPAGFRAVCFAFGTEGFFWCPLGPLVKPGPTWWKVGFLSSQLPRALPTTPATAAAAGSSGSAAGSDDGLLLVGWWVPEQ